jgi:hypothetical protein
VMRLLERGFQGPANRGWAWLSAGYGSHAGRWLGHRVRIFSLEDRFG